MSTPLRALIVEDSEDDVRLVLRELRRGGYDPTYERVDTPAAMRAALAEHTWDVVLSDYSMPSFSAPDALALLNSSDLDLPFIIISGTIGEDTAVAALRAGAHDFLLKDNLARLIPAIQREIREADVRRERQRAEAALQESQERYRRLVELSPDAILINHEDRVTFINQAGLRLFAATDAAQVIGKPAFELVHPDFHSLIRERNQRLRQAGEVAPLVEEKIVRLDGAVVEVEVATSLISDRAGSDIQIIYHDITERKRAEERIQWQLDRLSALRQIDTAITASLDLRLTLRIVLDQVTMQLAVDAADILLLNHHLQTLEYGAGRGFRSKAIERSRIPLGQGRAGRAAFERTLISLPNMDDEEPDLARAPLLAGEEFHAYYAVPLLAKGQVKGILEVFHRATLAPDDEWLNFLETLAGQAAIAIDNALLFDDLQRSNLNLIMAYDTTIEGWSRALDLRDKETEGHTLRVTEMTMRLAHAMGMSDADLVHIRRGALLHDIGKMGIPDHVLLKPGPLTEEEWEVMRRHPTYAYELLSPIPYLRPALDIPYCHHEKWDGAGYPRGLKGEQIPLAARIFAVADVYDALRSDRPYRTGWPEETVREHIRSLAGAHFEPVIVEAFDRLI